MAIGMCFGVAVASTLHINLGLGISIGMLIGEQKELALKRNKQFQFVDPKEFSIFSISDCLLDNITHFYLIKEMNFLFLTL